VFKDEKHPEKTAGVPTEFVSMKQSATRSGGFANQKLRQSGEEMKSCEEFRIPTTGWLGS
jgi:hypothetical protein